MNIPHQVVAAATPRLGGMVADQLNSIIEDPTNMDNQNDNALRMIRDWLRTNADEDVWAELVVDEMSELADLITNYLEDFRS
jgi:hypothetical protein